MESARGGSGRGPWAPPPSAAGERGGRPSGGSHASEAVRRLSTRPRLRKCLSPHLQCSPKTLLRSADLMLSDAPHGGERTIRPRNHTENEDATPGDFKATVHIQVEMTWRDFRRTFRTQDGTDSPDAVFLGLFERQYFIASPIEALVKIKPFLAEFIVKEFDYKSFCRCCGTATARVLEDDELWNLHVAENLSKDIASATSLMLRVAASIAKAYGLHVQDWRDINHACGNAIRTIPSCYRLQRGLPGALNDARALRYLPVPSDAAELDPWKSAEARRIFEEVHAVEWHLIESLTASDGRACAGFSGSFSIVDLTRLEGLTCVYLRALVLGAPMAGFPVKEVKEGDAVLWEVDSRVGAILERGLVIEGHWYEMQTEVCFLSALLSVVPEWAT